MIADMISPKSPKQGTELSRLERRMSWEPIQVASGPSEPVQYLAAPQLSVAVTPVAAAPAQPQAREQTAVPDDAFARARAAEAKRAHGKTQGRASPAMGREAPSETATGTAGGRAKCPGRHRAATVRGRSSNNASASVSSVWFGLKIALSLAAYTTSSVQTLKLKRVLGPKVWVIGTSAASRPWAIRTRPIRGMLLRASKVYQWPPI